MTGSGEGYVREEDREFFERELASFVPDRIFDAHCHLWNHDFDTCQVAIILPDGFPPQATQHDYCRLIDCLHPGRQISSLFIPYSVSIERDALGEANEWVGRQTKDSGFRGLFFAGPNDDPEWVRDEVRRLGLHGLKCYHLLADVKPTWECDIPDYLPESLVKVADQEGWVITLHLVKARAVADPGNIRWIRHYCEKYPNMKLILAHSARGFQPVHNLEGLPQLVGLENLYFDSSSNCEPMAHATIIRTFGHERLLYGSDFHVSHFRGRSLGAADSFLWLYEDTPVWGEKQATIKPVLIGLEHLRSLKWACWSTGLTDSQVQDIFWNNAAQVFYL